MNSLIKIAAVVVLASNLAHAQGRFQQEAWIMDEKGTGEHIWIADANKTEFLYFETEQGVDSKKMRISQPAAIWLVEPAEYTQAMELFQGRKYEEALAKFKGIREKYMKLIELPDNYSSLSAYYAMECLRKLNRLDELAKAWEGFLPDDRNNLTRPFMQTQLEIYAMWDTVRSKSWERLELQARGQLAKDLPGYQRAQAGYCLGLALEGQKRSLEAINAYNVAMTADTGASEVITNEAALNSMRLYMADDGVQLAIKLFGTPDENPTAPGLALLREAAALASLYETTLGDGRELPAEYKPLLKYVDEDRDVAEEPDTDAEERK